LGRNQKIYLTGCFPGQLILTFVGRGCQFNSDISIFLLISKTYSHLFVGLLDLVKPLEDLELTRKLGAPLGTNS